VTSVTPFRLKDVTGALRARRYRSRKKSNEINTNVTVDAPAGRLISASEMCSPAARVSSGRVTVEDLQLAERTIIAPVDRLPPDSSISVR
jgi:hypothetical protein